MINMKSLIDIYDWLIDQPGETPRLHADTLEMLIFGDLVHREKTYQTEAQDESTIL